MAVENRIDDHIADCKVYDHGMWRNGRYQRTRPDGKVVVEVVTSWAKTRRIFKPEHYEEN